VDGAAPPLADAVQVEVHHAQPGGVVHDLPAVQGLVAQVLPLVAVQLVVGDVVVAASRKPPVPQAGSQMVSPGWGRMTSTMAWISGRGVKYCPGADLTSWAFFSSSPS
jgi:hypothetical protein